LQLKASKGQIITIAGSSSGKKVSCSSQALPVYNKLLALANSGNYWAVMVVKGIRGLTTGHLMMDNVYVEKENNLAYGPGIFYIVLPGVRATIESYTNGSYELKGLRADASYMQMQEKTLKPGLWEISNSSNTPAKFQRAGAILKKEYRPVVISDCSPLAPDQIADSARDDMMNLEQIKTQVVHDGFDLHYTPGEVGIVGLKPVQEALATPNSRYITESATLLANTMYKARNITGVVWYSEWGGSAILTRALQILHKQNTKLEKHAIFLNRPTSKSDDALKLARELKLTLAGPNSTGKNTGLRINEIRGNHLHSKVTGNGAKTAGGFALGATGAVLTLTGIAPAIGAVASFGGAVVFVAEAFKAGRKKLSKKTLK
jgi:hypothetical protein